MVGWDAQLRYLADEVSKATPLDRRRPKASIGGSYAHHAACLHTTLWS